MDWKIDKTDVTMEHMIGSGSTATVYAASWRGTPVAVKVLKSDFDETDISTLLVHPNVVQVFGIVDETMIVMERMSSTVSRRTFKQQHALNICIDILRGLTYLHNREPNFLIHRDIKPSNILLTESGRAKISDFGLGVFKEDKLDSFRMTGNTGTYRYMAPEVKRCEEYGTPADMYSFAMCAYELFERKRPWEHLNTEQFIMSDLPRPRFSRTPKAIRPIIEMCWKENQLDRPTAQQALDCMISVQTLKCGCLQ